MRAELSLPSITAEEGIPEKKAPIRVEFEIPYFTVSGIQVCYSQHKSDLLTGLYIIVCLITLRVKC